MIRRALLIALAVLALSCGETPSVPRATAAPVIIISIDTLRADRLPAYGYDKIQTPHIDALRRDGVLYASAWSHAPLTLPSHLSLLTGKLPYEHGVRNNLGYTFDAAKHDTIPMMLKRNGYATGAAVSAYVLRGETGLGPAFDFYDDQVSGATNVGIGEVARDGVATATAATDWIALHASQPFFFFLHLFEPHWPYERSYDHEIVTADAIVGQFVDRLKRAGIYDRAMILLLSDHGEGLGDHGEAEHGVFVYRETMQVPLIVKLPNAARASTTVAHPVQLIDVLPTIAQITGTKPHTDVAGLSLLETPEEPRAIYGESLLPRIHFGWSELRSLVRDTRHFIDAPSSELFDLENDPREQKNIAANERRIVTTMRAELTRHASAFTAPSNVDNEEAEKLAALGYIGSVRTESGANLPDPKQRIGDVEALKAGSAHERRGALNEAANTYERILARNPQFADAWLRLAGVQEKLGRNDDAVHSYQRAISAAPVLAPQAALALGGLYLRMNRLDDADAHARLAVRTQPAAAHHLLGRIALARHDAATAETEARLAMRDTLYRGAASVLLARVRMAQGRMPDALRLLDEVKSPAPVRDLDATRGEILALMDRGQEAEAAFRAELAAFPQNLDAWSKLAILHYAMGRADESNRTLANMQRTVSTPQAAAVAEEVRKTLQP